VTCLGRPGNDLSTCAYACARARVRVKTKVPESETTNSPNASTATLRASRPQWELTAQPTALRPHFARYRTPRDGAAKGVSSRLDNTSKLELFVRRPLGRSTNSEPYKLVDYCLCTRPICLGKFRDISAHFWTLSPF